MTQVGVKKLGVTRSKQLSNMKRSGVFYYLPWNETLGGPSSIVQAPNPCAQTLGNHLYFL